MLPDTIEKIVLDYLTAKQEETNAKKRKDAAAALILQHAGVKEPTDAAYFETDGFRVDIVPKKREDLDRKKLKVDFPDIMDLYGMTVRWSQIDAREKPAAEALTA